MTPWSTSRRTRREFLRRLSCAGCTLPLAWRAIGDAPAGTSRSPAEQEILERIQAHRPSLLSTLPADFNSRFGATHAAGKYCFSTKPFLIEGAERLLQLGTRLGKFWFSPVASSKQYPFHSRWESYGNMRDLAGSEQFQPVWDMPFETIMLVGSSPVEQGWHSNDLRSDFYENVTREYYDLARYFFERFRDRSITIIVQNWEGDWLLRGLGKEWSPPPKDWRERCERMQRWLAARQAGVTQARRELAANSRCTVAHAAEVNRVADAWKGIPTMTREVLPGVEVDLVSYSAYDGIDSGDPLKFWRCLREIRQYARTGPLYGSGALAVGEYGIPENVRPERITERYDEMLGVMLLMNVRFAAHWQLFCNEFTGESSPPPRTPVTDSDLLRGFWLVRPDGSLSEGGAYFRELWNKAAGSR